MVEKPRDPILYKISPKVLELNLLPLVNLRKIPIARKEAYAISWEKDGQVLFRFANKTRAEIKDDKSLGDYTIYVKFQLRRFDWGAPLRNNIHTTRLPRCVMDRRGCTRHDSVYFSCVFL
jgi:hypothetical protein